MLHLKWQEQRRAKAAMPSVRHQSPRRSTARAVCRVAYLLVERISAQQLCGNLDRVVQFAPSEPRQRQIHRVEALKRTPACTKFGSGCTQIIMLIRDENIASCAKCRAQDAKAGGLTNRPSTCRKSGPGVKPSHAPPC